MDFNQYLLAFKARRKAFMMVFAAVVLAALAVAMVLPKTYVATSLDLRTEPSREAAAWFEDQLKGLRASVSQAQTKLTAYQKAKGIISTDERTDVESVRLNEISTQLMAARNATYDAQSRYKH